LTKEKMRTRNKKRTATPELASQTERERKGTFNAQLSYETRNRVGVFEIVHFPLCAVDYTF